MDFNSRKIKALTKKQLKNLSGENLQQHEVAVDSNLLDMLRSLQSANETSSSFADSLHSSIQKIGYDLRLALHLIRQKDKTGLDQLAQGLSQNALKLGATRLLSAAIEMQSLARIGDLIAVEELVNGLEDELRIVEKQLV